jgi:hypothetical protein
MTSAAVRRWWRDVDLVGCADREREKQGRAHDIFLLSRGSFVGRP